MTRGTFANIRLRNALVPGREGTRHLPDGEVMTFYDDATRYRGEDVPLVGPGRKGVRLRPLARLGGEGPRVPPPQGHPPDGVAPADRLR